ncbi:MAG: hypothetical protein P8O05_11785 [Flavobacteriales bacterium]|nr:hypothetical protein [Flavobacteriales bacterium]
MANPLQQAIQAFKKAKLASPHSFDGLAFECMSANVGYRLNQQEAASATIGLRVFVRTLKKIMAGGDPYKLLDGDQHTAILESYFVFEELESTYVSKLSGTSPGVFISKHDLPRQLKSTGGLVRYILFAIPLILKTFFSSEKRGNHAMQLAFVAEIAGLTHLIEEKKLHRLYDFAPYLIDANLAYLATKKEGFTYSKLPSPGPLSTHHHILFCDELILSSPYQFEEIKQLPNIHYTQLKQWVPEYGFTYIDQYISFKEEAPQQTIGYYSHGGWLRKAQGHTDDGLNIPEAEEQLLKDLGLFIASNPSFQLIIFPHPREKKEETWKDTVHFYEQFFPENQRVSINEQGLQTSKAFHHVDMAVAAFSTILYERLFCGFKTFIGNYGMDHFPMENSSLSPICFDNAASLSALLSKASTLTREEYFQHFQLKEYHYSAYPYFQPA